MIRVLVADDHAVVRRGLASLIATAPDLELVGTASDGAEAVQLAVDSGADVVVMDLSMPELDGVAATRELASQVPSCRVLILTTFGRAGYLRRAMEAGAGGFIVKDAPAEQLADAVRRVAAGERVVDAALAAATLAGGPSPLTARERDVLVAARDGATVADIAGKLFLSEGTVRNYLSAAIAKVGVRNRIEALRMADDRGWL